HARHRPGLLEDPDGEAEAGQLTAQAGHGLAEPKPEESGVTLQVEFKLPARPDGAGLSAQVGDVGSGGWGVDCWMAGREPRIKRIRGLDRLVSDSPTGASLG